jgi:hypothetical protein
MVEKQEIKFIMNIKINVMKQILFFKKDAKHLIRLMTCCIAVSLSALYVSCDDVYDNIKDFSMEEIVYPAHFDTAYGKIGYERVEIELSKFGRIPSSEMKLGKAKTTIIEYDGKRIPPIDSVCSWVSITGLTQPKLYRFKFYTADEFGNLSTPVEIALTPYTSDDLSALALPAPTFTESNTMALVEWKNRVSGDLFDFFSYTYSYTDRSGTLRTGSGDGDLPSFFIENVAWGQPVVVTITGKIIPKVNNSFILDTVLWEYPMVFAVEGAQGAIFLDTPANNVSLDITTSFPYALSWKKAEGVNDYSVAISVQSTFPNVDSLTNIIPAGNADRYMLQADDLTELMQQSLYANVPLYWKVVPSDNNPEIVTQFRQINVLKKTKKEYPLTLTTSGIHSITFTNEGDYYKVVTTGTDPYINTSGIPEKIEEKAVMLTYEYMASADFIMEYYFSTPNASGSKMTTSSITGADQWTKYSFDAGIYAKQFEWGIASGHRFRFDPSPGAGLTLYIRNIAVVTYE